MGARQDPLQRSLSNKLNILHEKKVYYEFKA